MSYQVHKTAQDLIREVARQTEAHIESQLNELISRGLIVVEQVEPTMTQEYNNVSGCYEVKVSQAVRLVPKEFEYIKKLEEENRELKEKLEMFNKLIESLK